MTTSDSVAAAPTSGQSVLRWPVLVVALFVATASAHSTVSEYLLTPFARTAFGFGIGVAAIGWAFILHRERAYLRRARSALPLAEFRRYQPPTAGRLLESLLFRWSVLFCISVAAVEYILEIAELRPSVGSLAVFAGLAMAATVLAVRRSVLAPRADTDETPDVSAESNIALSHPVRLYGSLLFVWGVWIFAWLAIVSGCLKVLDRW